MVVYEGPSMINGEPIVAIITGLDGVPSKNRKTGPMAQLWILDATEEPHVAVRTGRDESVCGDCPARGKWCYVTTFQGPLSIYRTWKRGSYGRYDDTRLRGIVLRLGAYGDPAALPLKTLRELTGACDRFTGYTHQWRSCHSELRHYCMASVDTVSDYEEAVRDGWRTFRVSPDGRKLKGESVCPASEEAGIDITCYDCGACDGRWRGERVKGNIVIAAHGAKSKQYLEEFA